MATELGILELPVYSVVLVKDAQDLDVNQLFSSNYIGSALVSPAFTSGIFLVFLGIVPCSCA